MTGRALLHAPAKLTVSLEVVARRPDGYHDIQAEMVAVDLFDRLAVDPEGSGVEIVAGPGARAERLTCGPDNLVSRALAAVGRAAAVRLEKRIPVGGGLGGGSSDAAAILRWAGVFGLDTAAKLGGDVPFCVRGGRALVEGVGDRV
ncbi:MAG: 4-(cytidine 5'-diphospho)-2-C-methyl-D-erythritol kinase, partial [Acidimicrobiales bacterium]